MNSTICQYCDTPWNKENTKAVYMTQDSLDCLYCPDCIEPNFIAFEGENESLFKSAIWKKRALNFLQFVCLVLLVEVGIFMWQHIRGNIGLYMLGLMYSLPLLLFFLPFSFKISKTQRKKIMWQYGHLSKTTYKEI